MRDAALRVIREIGVDTGGSNIQFAVNPKDGRMVVIEMNPRVSRSSALASKATGFPIAKIAAKLAVGYTLDEIPNDITRETPACFEPTIDYVVVKVPRFTFEKFPQAKDLLTPQMKSVGEAMAIGRTFKESLQKAMRSLEIGSYGFESKLNPLADGQDDAVPIIRGKLQNPNAQRLWYIGDAFRLGMTTEEIYQLSGIDPWFLDKIREIVAAESEIQAWRGKLDEISRELLRFLEADGLCRFPSCYAYEQHGSRDSGNCARKKESRQCSARWIPAALSSPPSRPISIRPTKGKTNPNRPSERRS